LARLRARVLVGGLAAQGMRADVMVSVFVINGNDISDSDNLPGVGTARAAHWARPRSLAGARSRSRSWPPARVRARVRAGAGGPAAAGERQREIGKPRKAIKPLHIDAPAGPTAPVLMPPTRLRA